MDDCGLPVEEREVSEEEEKKLARDHFDWISDTENRTAGDGCPRCPVLFLVRPVCPGNPHPDRWHPRQFCTLKGSLPSEAV